MGRAGRAGAGSFVFVFAIGLLDRVVPVLGPAVIGTVVEEVVAAVVVAAEALSQGLGGEPICCICIYGQCSLLRALVFYVGVV